MYLKTLNITKGAMVAPIWRARTTVSGLNQARVTVCRAGTPPTGGSPSQKLGLSKRTQRVLPLLSELVDVQATTAAFETLAGRSAMLGFAIAVFLEAGLLPTLDVQGVFGTFGALEAFAWLGISLVACSTVLALASTRKVLRRSIGKRLLEPVLASLTSKSRSDGAVSGRNVDGALDAVMDSTFSAAFLRAVLPSEADEPYI